MLHGGQLCQSRVLPSTRIVAEPAQSRSPVLISFLAEVRLKDSIAQHLIACLELYRSCTAANAVTLASMRRLYFITLIQVYTGHQLGRTCCMVAGHTHRTKAEHAAQLQAEHAAQLHA